MGFQNCLPSFRVFMFIFILILILIINGNAVAEDIVQTTNQTTRLWHSYLFNTGVQNREDLHLSKIAVVKDLKLGDKVWRWEILQSQGQTKIFGVGENFLSMNSLEGNHSLSLTHKQDIHGFLKDLSLFQKWNTITQEMDKLAMTTVSINDKESVLKCYQVVKDSLKHLWDWPVSKNFTSLKMIETNHDLKFLLISQDKGRAKSSSAEIYSLVGDRDLWLDDRFFLEGIPSSVEITKTSDDLFLSLSYSSLGYVQIYKYTSSNSGFKHFTPFQKIPCKGLVSVTSFHTGIYWYLAIASSVPSIYCFKSNAPLSLVANFDKQPLKRWFPIHVDTYRDDVILLAESSKGIFVFFWKGNQKPEMVGKLSHLYCDNDDSCHKKEDHVSLLGAATFFHNNRFVILPSKVGEPLVIKLSVSFEHMPSKVEEELKEPLKLRASLQAKWDNQQRVLESLKNINEISLNEDEEDLIPSLTSSTVSNPKFILAKKVDLLGQSKANITEFARNKNWRLEDPQIHLQNLVLNKAISTNLRELHKKLKEQEITNKKATSLPGSIKEGIEVTGTIIINKLFLDELNGYNVSEMLRDSYRTDRGGIINGTKTLKNVEASNISFEKLADIPACNLVFSDDLYDGAIIQGDVVYENDLTILQDFNLMPGGLINNMTLKDILHIDTFFNHSVAFENLTITNETIVTRTINGRPLILPIRSSPLNVHSLDNVNQARVERVNVSNLDITHLNGIDIKELMEGLVPASTADKNPKSMKIDGVYTARDLNISYLNDKKFPEDFITLKSEDPIVVTGEKSFHGILKVDRMYTNDPSELEKLMKPKRSYIFKDLKVHGAVITESINNITWNYLDKIVQKNDEGKYSITGLKKFVRGVSSPNIKLLGGLNNKSIDGILTLDTAQIITHPPILNNVAFQNLTLNGTWNGICVECLNKSAIRISGDNIVKGTLKCAEGGEIIANDLRILNSINEVITPDKLFLKNGDIVWNGNISLPRIEASKMTVNGSLITMNTVNLNLANTTEEYQPTSDEREDKTTVYNDNSYKNSSRNAMFKKPRESTITDLFLNGKINRIKNLFVRGNIITKSGVNNINLTEVMLKAIDITKPNSILQDVVFEDKVSFSKLNITGRINGIDLKRFQRDVVYKKSNAFIRGNKEFLNGIRVKNLNVRTINGILLKNIISKHGDHMFKGPVQINGDVVVEGNLHCDGSIDGTVVRGLHQKFSLKHNAFIIPGDLELSNGLVSVDNLVVGGSINGIDFDPFMSEVISVDDDFVVEGDKVFTGEVIFQSNLTVTGLINNLNFSKFYDDIVLVNRPAKISGRAIFETVVIKNLFVKNEFNSTRINQCNMDDWIEESIPLDGSIFVKGNKTFADVHSHDDIQVDLINDKSLDSTIPLKTEQHIPASVHFSRIDSLSDITVNGLVNDKLLPVEFEDSLLVSGNQTMSGKLIFNDSVIIEGDLYTDNVNGRNIHDFITLHTDQTIKSIVSFQGQVIVDQNIEDVETVNGVDIVKWNRDSVSLNKNQTITGHWTIKGDVYALKDVTGQSYLDSANPVELSKSLERKKSLALKIEEEMREEYQTKCEGLRNISMEISRQPYLLQEFDLVYSFGAKSPIEALINFKAKGNDYFIVTFTNDCRSLQYRWNSLNSSLLFVNEIHLGPVKKWISLNHENSTYLITTSSLDDKLVCETNQRPGNVWSFNGDHDTYGHVVATDAFIDIIKPDSESNKFYTLNNDGSIYEWLLENDGSFNRSLIISLEGGHYRFMDNRIMGGLAVTNGDEIRKISVKEGSFSEVLFNTNLPGLSDGEMAATVVEKKVLTAVAYRDKVIVYDDPLQGDVFSLIPSFKPKSLLWINYGPGREVFLVFQSMQRRIDIFQYNGLSGFRKRMTLPVRSVELQLINLPLHGRGNQKYLVAVQNKKILLLQMQMLGYLYSEDDILC